MIAFGSLGIQSANIYFVGSKKYKIQDAVSNSLILAILLGFLLILLFWGMLQFSSFQKFIYLNHIPTLSLWIVIFTIPVSLLLIFFQGIICGKGEIINYNKTRLAGTVFQLVAVILLLLILKQGIFGAVFSYVFSIIGAVLFTIILIKKISNFHLFLNKKLLKDSAIYGGKVSLANATSFFSYRLDMLLIAMFLTPAAVGFYSIAVGISEKLLMMPGALATVLFPRVSSINYPEANNLTPRVVRHNLFIMIIVSLLLIILSRPLVEFIFGSAFLPSVMPLLILLPGIIAFGIGGVIAADLSGRGRPEFAIYSSLACLVTNIFLNIILIPKWGISGAALASSIAYWVDTLIIIFVFLKISRRPLHEFLLIRREDFHDYYKFFSALWKKEN
jgi:O-antigen/teichoic acid export membrane protein